jgi:N-acetyltransferase
MKFERVTMRGRHVWLEPAAIGHLDDLWTVAQHKALWAYMPTPARTLGEMTAFLSRAIQWGVEGTGQYFVQHDIVTGEVIGGTGYLNADHSHRRVEIGGTWVTPARQRTPVNTEAKLLMLRYAFESLGCIRVEFKVDSLNTRSLAALLRIGAQQEGTLRNHMVMPDGRFRHSVYFSVIQENWLDVAARLEALLDRPCT